MVSNFDAFYFCKYLQDYKFGEIYVWKFFVMRWLLTYVSVNTVIFNF
jgi:hypothetical protein